MRRLETLKPQTLKTFQVLPNEVESAIGRVFDSVLVALDALPRVETKLYPLLDNPKTLALRVDDARLVGLKDDIMRVFRPSMAAALAVVGLYDNHSYLLDESQRLSDWACQPRTLAEFKDRSVGADRSPIAPILACASVVARCHRGAVVGQDRHVPGAGR